MVAERQLVVCELSGGKQSSSRRLDHWEKYHFEVSLQLRGGVDVDN